jgi:hypothetical protein
MSSSSPMRICLSSPWNRSKYRQSEALCDCANQLAHVDWNGVPHKNLPDLCKRSMGIAIEDTTTSQENGKQMSNGLYGKI